MLMVNLDIAELAELMNVKDAIKDATDGAARDLAAMTHGKIAELAGQKLHSRREMFVTGLKYHQESDDLWIVSLDAKVRWVDDGLPAHSMLDDLLASPKAKKAKDGSKYIVVPFGHGPGAGKTSTTPPQQDLISTVKKAMKARGIPFGTIEKDDNGSAKLGRLHSFDITKAPVKSLDGPGQGKGPKGAVKQGPTGIPFLQGVSVYQSQGPGGKTKRQILTFRVASSKHREQSRWEHPGTTPMNLMEEGMQWAMETWQKEIAPAIVSKISMKMGD